MKRFVRYSWLVSVLFVGGCATNPSTPVEMLARQDVVNSRITGAIVGEIAGRVIGSNTGLGEGRGAFVGALVGGMAGTAIGKSAANRRLKYAYESDFIESEIASSQKAIDSKNGEIRRLRSKINDTRNEISELRKRHRENEDVVSDAASILEGIDKQIERNQAQLNNYKSAIAYLDEVIATSRRQAKSGEGLETKRNQLIARRARLNQTYQEMQGINASYKEQKSRVAPLTHSRETSSSSASQNTPFGIPNIPNFKIPTF